MTNDLTVDFGINTREQKGGGSADPVDFDQNNDDVIVIIICVYVRISFYSPTRYVLVLVL